MSKPKIAAREPVAVDIEPGRKYFWCRCGLSATQPYCDGSHVGTDFQPLEFEVKEKKRMYLCRCKHTKNEPQCDGTHTKLPEE